MGYSRKNPDKGQELSTWNFESRCIEERAHEYSRVQLKKKWNFWGFYKETLMWNFLGFWFLTLKLPRDGTEVCRIWRVESLFSLDFLKVKLQVSKFQREYFRHPICLDFFWNSPAWKKNRRMGGTAHPTPPCSPNHGKSCEDLKLIGVYWKSIMWKFQRSIKIRIGISRDYQKILGFWSWVRDEDSFCLKFLRIEW